MKWYVVQVMSSKELKVKRSIEESLVGTSMKELVEEILVPVENVSEVKRGKQKIVEKRLWPGYVLMKMNITDELWLNIKSVSGVLDFLGGEKPIPLSEKEIKAILDDLKDKKEKVVHKHSLEIGDPVKIIDGVFINFIGNVVEVFHDKGKVSVKVSIFGRDTRVDDLEFWQIEKVSYDAT